MRFAFLLFTVLISLTETYAGGLRGRITTQQNEPLPYAGIVVKGTSNGTMANAEGSYEFVLEPGSYEIIFYSCN